MQEAEQVVKCRVNGTHWLIVEQGDNGVKLQNFKGQFMSQDWPTFNHFFEYPFYGSPDED